MTDRAALFEDLRTEGDELEQMVAALDLNGWVTPTPAQGWTIAHQIAHLTWTDKEAILAATDAVAFDAEIQRILASGEDPVEAGVAHATTTPPEPLLADWRVSRRELLDALAGVPEGARVPWFGPPMSAASMATARLMETWAHGQDIADALKQTRTPTARLKHVAHIGVRARDYAYRANSLEPPSEHFRVELIGPDGESWAWGPEESNGRVTGPALDFCLLVTQRRHRDDLAVAVQGEEADRWLGIAQAFAGPPGPGRRAGQFG